MEVNNGTLRITVRWRPTKYQELLADKTLWNYEATDLVHFILGTATGAVIYPWESEPGVVPPIPCIKLTPDHLFDIIGQQILPTSPTKSFIFSFRLCLTTGPWEWLTNPNTKRNLEHHHSELSLSNASSSSGNITTAGFIFFKHHTMTHRFFSQRTLQNTIPNSSIL